MICLATNVNVVTLSLMLLLSKFAAGPLALAVYFSNSQFPLVDQTYICDRSLNEAAENLDIEVFHILI